MASVSLVFEVYSSCKVYYLSSCFGSTPLRYYTNGQTAVLPDFFSVPLLDRFIFDAKVTKMYVDEYQPGTELWLGETSSTYGGGTPVLSGAYVAGFM